MFSTTYHHKKKLEYYNVDMQELWDHFDGISKRFGGTGGVKNIAHSTLSNSVELRCLDAVAEGC